MPVLSALASGVVEQAVEKMLEKEGLLTDRENFVKALENNGLTTDTLAGQLAGLVFGAKDAVRLRAIETALSAKGIETRNPQAPVSAPVINLMIHSTENKVMQMFAPVREIKNPILESEFLDGVNTNAVLESGAENPGNESY